MKWAKATDANHKAVLATLRQFGIWAKSVHQAGAGFPDILAWTSKSGFVLLEVKDGAKVASARKLTPAQEKFFAECPGPIHVVTSGTEALAVFGIDALEMLP